MFRNWTCAAFAVVDDYGKVWKGWKKGHVRNTPPGLTACLSITPENGKSMNIEDAHCALDFCKAKLKGQIYIFEGRGEGCYLHKFSPINNDYDFWIREVNQ